LFYAGPISCSVTQLFAKVILDIPHALLLAAEETEERNDSKVAQKDVIDTTLDVEFSEDAIILKNSDGNIAIEVKHLLKIVLLLLSLKDL
jgi:hypothetical protein